MKNLFLICLILFSSFFCGAKKGESSMFDTMSLKDYIIGYQGILISATMESKEITITFDSFRKTYKAIFASSESPEKIKFTNEACTLIFDFGKNYGKPIITYQDQKYVMTYSNILGCDEYLIRERNQIYSLPMTKKDRATFQKSIARFLEQTKQQSLKPSFIAR